MSIAMAKEAFDRKISLSKSKVNMELRKKLVRCIGLYVSEIWTLKKLEWKYLESFEMWCWKGMDKINWSEKVTNEVLK